MVPNTGRRQTSSAIPSCPAGRVVNPKTAPGTKLARESNADPTSREGGGLKRVFFEFHLVNVNVILHQTCLKTHDPSTCTTAEAPHQQEKTQHQKKKKKSPNPITPLPPFCAKTLSASVRTAITTHSVSCHVCTQPRHTQSVCSGLLLRQVFVNPPASSSQCRLNNAPQCTAHCILPPTASPMDRSRPSAGQNQARRGIVRLWRFWVGGKMEVVPLQQFVRERACFGLVLDAVGGRWRGCSTPPRLPTTINHYTTGERGGG